MTRFANVLYLNAPAKSDIFPHSFQGLARAPVRPIKELGQQQPERLDRLFVQRSRFITIGFHEVPINVFYDANLALRKLVLPTVQRALAQGLGILWLQTIEIPEPKALLADVFDPAGFERLADKMRICNKTEPLEQVQKEIPSAFASEIFKPDFTKVSSQIPNRAACAYLRMPQPGIAVNSGRRPGSRPGVGSGSKRTDDAPRVTNDVNEIGVWNKFKNERGIGHMLW